MTTTLLLTLLTGILLASGLLVLARAFTPARTDLADGLVRLDSVRWEQRTAAANTAIPADTERSGGLTTLLAWLSRYLVRLRLSTPDSDLALIGWKREQFLGLRVLGPVVGLAVGPVMGALLWALGIPLPWVFSLAQSLLLAAVIWWAIGRQVTTKADDARRNMKYALVSYINVVALHRAAGSGIVAALEQAAGTADSWAFRRIALQLDHSARAGEQPWEGLAMLAAELDISELADIGSIADVSGRQGGTVFDTLLARARSLRGQLLTEEKTLATEASTKMTYPQTILAFVVMIFLMFPAVIRLAGG